MCAQPVLQEMHLLQPQPRLAAGLQQVQAAQKEELSGLLVLRSLDFVCLLPHLGLILGIIILLHYIYENASFWVTDCD